MSCRVRINLSVFVSKSSKHSCKHTDIDVMCQLFHKRCANHQVNILVSTLTSVCYMMQSRKLPNQDNIETKDTNEVDTCGEKKEVLLSLFGKGGGKGADVDGLGEAGGGAAGRVAAAGGWPSYQLGREGWGREWGHRRGGGRLGQQSGGAGVAWDSSGGKVEGEEPWEMEEKEEWWMLCASSLRAMLSGKEEVTQQPPNPTLSKEKGRGKANGQAQKTYSSPRFNIPASHKCHGKTSAGKGRTEEQKQVPKQNTQKPNRQPSSRNTKPSTGNRGDQQETEGIDRKPKGQTQTKKTSDHSAKVAINTSKEMSNKAPLLPHKICQVASSKTSRLTTPSKSTWSGSFSLLLPPSINNNLPFNGNYLPDLDKEKEEVSQQPPNHINPKEKGKGKGQQPRTDSQDQLSGQQPSQPKRPQKSAEYRSRNSRKKGKPRSQKSSPNSQHRTPTDGTRTANQQKTQRPQDREPKGCWTGTEKPTHTRKGQVVAGSGGRWWPAVAEVVAGGGRGGGRRWPEMVGCGRRWWPAVAEGGGRRWWPEVVAGGGGQFKPSQVVASLIDVCIHPTLPSMSFVEVVRNKAKPCQVIGRTRRENIVVKGGVTWMKDHLSESHRNTASQAKVPHIVREEIKAYMN
ncbi:hypothetical protein M5K25_017707 [Dendrobium thyrsiflorum]|uniref:Uncharacterized protein n=1 Tax=Dendrobium thyrsiflorum TaxID=117978 RepID=A0ABD0UUT6_DENTH